MTFHSQAGLAHNSPRRLNLSSVAAVALACAAGAACGQPQGSRLHPVTIRELAFQPRDLPVAQGDTITWTNHDIVPHTVTANDASWDSGDLPPGGAFTLVADGADAPSYTCRYHPTMAGRLVPK